MRAANEFGAKLSDKLFNNRENIPCFNVNLKTHQDKLTRLYKLRPYPLTSNCYHLPETHCPSHNLQKIYLFKPANTNHHEMNANRKYPQTRGSTRLLKLIWVKQLRIL